MAKGRQVHDWDQTSIMWATFANAYRDPKKRSKPFCPSQVHPHRSARDYKPKAVKGDFSALKKALFGDKNGRHQGG